MLYVVHRDNTTDDQECSGLGTCLCGDCVCTKEGVSGSVCYDTLNWIPVSLFFGPRDILGQLCC